MVGGKQDIPPLFREQIHVLTLVIFSATKDTLKIAAPARNVASTPREDRQEKLHRRIKLGMVRKQAPTTLSIQRGGGRISSPATAPGPPPADDAEHRESV